MDRETAKQEAKRHLYDYLRTKGIDAANKRKFTCFNAAAHDGGTDNHASMYVYENKKSGLVCYCPVCKEQYDIFDLVGRDYGLATKKEQFAKVYEMYGLEVQNKGKTERKEYRATMNTQSALHNNQQQAQAEYKLNFNKEMEEGHANLLKNEKPLEYLQEKRGLSMDIIERYKVCYMEGGYNSFLQAYPAHQSNGKKAGLYRLIFPYLDDDGQCSYFLAEIADRKQVDEYNGKYKKITKGATNLEAQLFNERYIKRGANCPPVIFICEGIYDALSVEDVGGKAIAFVGTAHKRFLSLCEKYQPKTKFIISLDNDKPGQDATQAVVDGLRRLGIRYSVQPSENGKDFNDALQADRGALQDLVDAITHEDERAEREAYLQTSVEHYLSTFVDDIAAEQQISFLPTGFRDVDDLLDGGLYAGLYIVGAISSLGKTTFALQCMDYMAAHGQDVLIFSLEISKKELMAKSISRHTMLSSLSQYGSTQYAKTTRGILTGSRYANYSKQERELIDLALIDYDSYADHIYIHEGVGDIGIMQVRAEIEKHIRLTGNTPCVLLDYVQILAPYNDRATDKQNCDKAVLELKRMSRDYRLPIIGISSFNRESYTDPVTMAAFKESGAIEYTSDCLIALQYDGMDYRDKEKKEERNRRVRELLEEQAAKGKAGEAQRIQVKVLKNRNGAKGSVCLDFYPMFNRFTDIQTDEGDLMDVPY